LFKKLLSPYLCNPETEKLPEVLGSVVQLVRMPPCHGGGRGFESRPVRSKALISQTVKGFFVYISHRSLPLDCLYLIENQLATDESKKMMVWNFILSPHFLTCFQGGILQVFSAVFSANCNFI